MVTDFTGMTNQQIIDLISGTSNICGRIENWQLDSVNRQLSNQQQSRFNWKSWGLAASLLVAIPAFKASAQQPHKVKAQYHKQIVLNRKQQKTEQLTAHYLGFTPETMPIVKINSVNIDSESEQVRYTLVGGITVGVKITENKPVSFFRDGSYQRAFDLIQSVISQTFLQRH